LRLQRHLFLLLPLIAAATGAVVKFWVCDDAFISFRYGKNLADGFGLVFNPGTAHPIEGYSNFLWVLVAAAFELANARPEAWLPAISILCTLVLVWRVYSVLCEQLQCDSLTASLVCLSLATFPPFTVWATGGLATMPFALLIFLTFESIVLRERTSTRAACSWATLLCLIRAEGFAWALVLGLLALIFRKNRRRDVAWYLTAVLCITCLQLVIRHAYYDSWWPNTAHVKLGMSQVRWLRGWNYDVVFVLTFLTPIAASFSAFLLPGRRYRYLVLTSGAMFAGFYGFAVVAGGDYMSMGRFLVPSLAFQTLLLGALCAFFCERDRRVLARLVAVAIVALGIIPEFRAPLVPESFLSRFPFRMSRHAFIGEADHWRSMKRNSERWRAMGELLARYTQPGESLVATSIGNVGYFSNLIIYDRFGLVSRIPATAAARDLGSPGHDSHVTSLYFLDEKPTYLEARISAPNRLPALARSQRAFPPPYAPVVFEVSEGRYLVLIKRHASREACRNAWQRLRDQWL